MQSKNFFLTFKQIVIAGCAVVLTLSLAPLRAFADEPSNVVDVIEISADDLANAANADSVDDGLDALGPADEETGPSENPGEADSEETTPVESTDDPETPEMEAKFTWQTIGADRVLFDEHGNRLTGWQEVDGETYYFNVAGILQFGWQSISGSWYHFSNTGALDRSRWIYDKQTWYYVQDSGVMAEGWIKDCGSWYWLKPGSGAMQTGWLLDRGTWYYLASSGAMKTGWYRVAGTWYYSNASGAMKTGWLKDDGTWYYLMPSGAMKTGWLKVGGIWYDFKNSGALDVMESAIWQLEEELMNNPYSNGRKYENALLNAGGSLTNGSRGLWCVNYLWWGFHRIGMNNEVWGSTGLQVDPDYLREEAKSLGRLHTSLDGIQRGDILFTYFSSWRPDITASHGAIVTNVSGRYVTVLEGNIATSGSGLPTLRSYTFSLDDSIMRGYYRPAY